MNMLILFRRLLRLIPALSSSCRTRWTETPDPEGACGVGLLICTEVGAAPPNGVRPRQLNEDESRPGRSASSRWPLCHWSSRGWLAAFLSSTGFAELEVPAGVAAMSGGPSWVRTEVSGGRGASGAAFGGRSPRWRFCPARVR